MAEINIEKMAQDVAEKAIQELRDNGVFVSGWIPVGERLPDKNVWVLVTVEQDGIRYLEIMRRHKYIDAWTDTIDNYTDEITAWIPLPEPYKAKSEDEK